MATEYSECLDNFSRSLCLNHVTGLTRVERSDLILLKANVCPYRGDVTFKVDADESWITTGSWTVPENTLRWKATFDEGCDVFLFFNDCPWMRVSIKDAENDGYQFRWGVLE